jgi:Lipocalin-like domain
MRQEDLVGAWRLKEFRFYNADGKVSHPWAAASRGLLCYTHNGFMSASILQIDKQRHAQFLSYCGPFEFQDNCVIHHIKMSSNDRLVGTDQVRRLSFDGETLTLSASPSLYGGEGTSTDLLWHRA